MIFAVNIFFVDNSQDLSNEDVERIPHLLEYNSNEG